MRMYSSSLTCGTAMLSLRKSVCFSLSDFHSFFLSCQLGDPAAAALASGAAPRVADDCGPMLSWAMRSMTGVPPVAV